jgi:hypothetical protein
MTGRPWLFISYRRSQREAVRPMLDALRALRDGERLRQPLNPSRAVLRRAQPGAGSSQLAADRRHLGNSLRQASARLLLRHRRAQLAATSSPPSIRAPDPLQ